MKPAKQINIDAVGKVPPQCVEIEESLLGIIMVYPDALSIVLELKLKPMHFYKESHGMIFAAIIKLNSNKTPFDIVSVTNQLQKEGSLDTIGGGFYITSLSMKAIGIYQSKPFAMEIKEKFAKREIIRITSEVQSYAFDDLSQIDECLNDLKYGINGIENEFEMENAYEFGNLVDDSVNRLEERNSNFLKGIMVGIPTPVMDLTKAINGFQNGLYYILAARPSMGKTACLVAIAKTAAKNNYKPAIFSLEMKATKLADRMLVGESGIKSDDFNSGNVTKEDWRALERIIPNVRKWIIPVYDNSSITIGSIERKCQKLKKKNQCDLILIDYLQLAKPEEKGNNREADVAGISRACKALAKNLDTPVIVLAQVGREVDKTQSKKPQLSMLRESGGIEADADAVIFIHRPEYYGQEVFDDGSSTKGVGIFYVAKQRDGSTGDILFRYNESLTQIYDHVSESFNQSIPASSRYEKENIEIFDNTMQSNTEFDKPF